MRLQIRDDDRCLAALAFVAFGKLDGLLKALDDLRLRLLRFSLRFAKRSDLVHLAHAADNSVLAARLQTFSLIRAIPYCLQTYPVLYSYYQQGRKTMTAAEINIGKVYYFGWKKTPNTVTRVTPLPNHAQYIARIELKGPRGGKFVAHVRHDGSCRKI